MHRLRVRGLGPLLVMACALAIAGTANAQCEDPEDIPADLFENIFESAGFDFGDLPESTCNSITKKGVSTCKTLVKGAAKCLDQVNNANHDIAVKQCNELENPDKQNCKDEWKVIKESVKDDNKAEKDAAIDDCEGEFGDDLFGLCLLGPL